MSTKDHQPVMTRGIYERNGLCFDFSQTNSEIKLTKEFLLTLLKESNWNKAEVGRRIQKSRTSVWKYMKKWKIPLTEG